jgi:hypothetical protein
LILPRGSGMVPARPAPGLQYRPGRPLAG